MINNSYVKKKFWLRVGYLVAAVLCIIAAYFSVINSAKANEKADENLISFAEAYEKDMVSKEYRNKNDFKVYVELTEKPVKFAYYDDKSRECYYFLYSDGMFFLMRAYDSAVQKINQQIDDEGHATVKGPLEDVDSDIKDIAFEVVEEAHGLTRDEFNEYYRGVALSLNATSDKASSLEGLAFLFVVAGIILFIIGIKGVIGFITGFMRLSSEEKSYLESELTDPRTTIIKACDVILTPNYFVYTGNKFRAVPFSEIMWTYRHNWRFRFFSGSYLKLYSSKDKIDKVANIGPVNTDTSGMDREIFTVINQHNPSAALGYSQQAIQQYNHLRSTLGLRVG